MALSFFIVSIVPLILYNFTIMVSIENYYVGNRTRRLLQEADGIANNLDRANYLSKINEDAFRRLWESDLSNQSRNGGYRILVLDSGFNVIEDTNQKEIGNMVFIPEVLSALTRKNEVKLRKSEKNMYAAAAIHNEDSQRIGAVLLVESADDLYEALSEIQQSILMYTFLVGMIVCVLVFFMSHLLINPLRKIAQVVQKMADGHLDRRIEISGRDEYAQLGLAFNDLTARLAQADKSRENFVSDVSHELKTPLSSMKVLSESILLQDNAPIGMYREFLQDITSEVDRMTMIINDLLSLVKINQREHGLNLEPTELNKLVEDILKRLSPLAEQKRVVLLYEDVRKVTMQADAVKLSLAISNIVENGIKYTPSGGTVMVIVDADHQNAIITIKDTGIGIPEEEQANIFNRFYRVDKTRDRETGGTGLGLAISHSAVLLHNGSVRLSSKINEGSVFVIRLPLRNMV